MDRYLALFSNAVERARPLLDTNQIKPAVGSWYDSVVLKLQKDGWTSDNAKAGPAACGIFFSIWIDAKSLKQARALYNIHALRLRELPGYTITSRDFAAGFRAKFSASSKRWPHVSTDFGPQTLMQGWFELAEPERFGRNVDQLIHVFVKMHGTIDALLAQHRQC